MYLRGSKWNMRQRRPKINWFLVILVVILIAVVTYVDRFILPTAQTPFMPTPTVTRDPESYVTEAQADFDAGKLDDAINTYLEAIRITPKDPSLYIALARVQIFAGKYADALVNAENSLLLNPNSSMAQAVRGWALTQKGNYTAAELLKDLLTELKVPILSNFPAGHIPNNWTLPLGAKMRIDADSKSIRFLDAAVR